MSLKAKIEAVIYAAEEPVTLQQLVGLLGQEAQAELAAAEALQGRLALDAEDVVVVLQTAEPGDPDLLNAETLGGDVLEGAVGPPRVTASLPVAEGAEAGAELQVSPLRREPPQRASAPGTPDAAPVEMKEDKGDEAPSVEMVGEAPVENKTEPLTAAQTRAGERRLREYMRGVLDALVAEYRDSDRGLEIREIAGGYRFATKPEYHDAVRGFVRSLKPPLKLSLQALETLAVVAYKQPVTAPEVGEIRGVDSAGVLGSLTTRKLVTTAGRKQVIGRPILYKTTKEFLLRFGLKDLQELPSIEEFERLASNLNEAVQEEIPMAETPIVPVADAAEMGPLSTAEVERDVDPNRDVHLPQADGDPGEEVDAENLTPAPDGPSEFTGDENVPPAENVTTDGRISGVPPTYDPSADEMADSPANDALVQSGQLNGQGGE